MRRRLAPFFAGFFWLASVSFVGSAEKVTFMLDWVPYGVHAGFYSALSRGYYAQAGLDVTIQRGVGGASTAVGSEKIHFGLDSPANILLGRGRGLKVKMVSMFRDKGLMTVFALKSSGIRSPKDLEGKSIGVTVGDFLHGTFKVFAELTGIRTWNWVPLAPPSKNPSLLAKKVDAIATFTTVGIPLRLEASKMGDGIVEFLWSEYGVKMPTDGIVAHEKTIEDRPDLARKFVLASLRGNAWGIDHPKGAVGEFLKYFPEKKRGMEEAFWAISVKHQWTESVKPHGLGYIDPEKMRYTRDVMVKAYEKVDKAISAEGLYTTKLLPAPLPKPKAP